MFYGSLNSSNAAEALELLSTPAGDHNNKLILYSSSPDYSDEDNSSPSHNFNSFTEKSALNLSAA